MNKINEENEILNKKEHYKSIIEQEDKENMIKTRVKSFKNKKLINDLDRVYKNLLKEMTYMNDAQKERFYIKNEKILSTKGILNGINKKDKRELERIIIELDYPFKRPLSSDKNTRKIRNGNKSRCESEDNRCKISNNRLANMFNDYNSNASVIRDSSIKDSISVTSSVSKGLPPLIKSIKKSNSEDAMFLGLKKTKNKIEQDDDEISIATTQNKRYNDDSDSDH